MESSHLRNVDARACEGFSDDVFVRGWEERSVWGWDDAAQSFYGQLWRNGSSADDEPDCWLAGVTERYPRAECLALRMMPVLGVDPLTMMNGLGLGATAEPTAPLGAIEEQLRSLGTQPAGYGFGRRLGLEWLRGGTDRCPGSGWAWNKLVPTRPVINAESRVLTGRIYLGEHDPTLNGIDDALGWALSG